MILTEILHWFNQMAGGFAQLEQYPGAERFTWAEALNLLRLYVGDCVQMTDRPELTPSISVDDFRDYYWLKEELLAFCRQNGLPSGGSKREIGERIEHFLGTGEIRSPQPRSSSQERASMPETFTRHTVIGPGWRCSQALRVFFETEIGPGFHFDQVMRDFIKQGHDKTLQDAIDAWQEAKSNPVQKAEIAPQFEYMRHMRAYFDEHPEGTRDEALAAWHEKKSQRKSSNLLKSV